MKKNNPPIVISLGGSLVVPDDLDLNFLKRFRSLILAQIKKGQKFIIIVGGGKIARLYQTGAKAVSRLTDEDLDWLGIHATRLNAHLLRTIFRTSAYPKIITNRRKINPKITAPIIIAAGFKPGCSTDYDAVLLARAYKAKTIINLSNIPWVYTCDPRKFKSAKPIKKISWPAFQKLVGTKWDPGANVPFDPVASRWASKWGMRVIICNGKDFKNMKNTLSGQDIIHGTIIN
ncbi:UMP kinase [Candidatus Parcubacteria bacterium]|jgi:uridylate kinase|nr:MAG: UMP kinase [Candidatus Parcubacteria bacterium]